MLPQQDGMHHLPGVFIGLLHVSDFALGIKTAGNFCLNINCSQFSQFGLVILLNGCCRCYRWALSPISRQFAVSGATR